MRVNGEVGRKDSFEVTLNGELIYSRLSTGQFPNNEEVAATVRKMVGGEQEEKKSKFLRRKCTHQ